MCTENDSYLEILQDQLKPLLRTPDRNLAKELRMRFHPSLREEERPKSAGHKVGKQWTLSAPILCCLDLRCDECVKCPKVSFINLL